MKRNEFIYTQKVFPVKNEQPLDLLETEIFVNEKDTGIKEELAYDIFFDHEKNQFVATRSLMCENKVDNAPTEIRWNFTRKLINNSVLDTFTDKEINEILAYRGMTLKGGGGIFMGDVFMYGEHMEFASKK